MNWSESFLSNPNCSERTFKNDSYTGVIKELTLIKYNYEGYNSNQIVIHFHNNRKKEILYKVLKQAGLPKPSTTQKSLDTYRLRCNNLLPWGAILLQAIRPFQSDFSEIEQQIINETGIDFQHEYKQTPWIDIISFREDLSSGTDLNKKLTFISTSTKSIIKELNFVIYQNGKYQITANFYDHESYKRMLAAAKIAELPKQESFDKTQKCFKLICDNLAPQGVVMLGVIKSLEPLFSVIEKQIDQELSISLNQNSKHSLPRLPLYSSLSSPQRFFSPNIDMTSMLLEFPVINLNDTQKNIIEGILFFPFSSVEALSKTQDKILVLNLINKPILTLDDEVFLKQVDTFEEIKKIRDILEHPYPQNSSENDLSLSRVNIPEDHVVFKNAAGVVSHEPRGLLSITCMGAVEKEDVCQYINFLIDKQLEKIKSNTNVNEENVFQMFL